MRPTQGVLLEVKCCMIPLLLQGPAVLLHRRQKSSASVKLLRVRSPNSAKLRRSSKRWKRDARSSPPSQTTPFRRPRRCGARAAPGRNGPRRSRSGCRRRSWSGCASRRPWRRRSAPGRRRRRSRGPRSSRPRSRTCARRWTRGSSACARPRRSGSACSSGTWPARPRRGTRSTASCWKLTRPLQRPLATPSRLRPSSASSTSPC
mmetsp:Transcript_44225/g.140887  ORF Transcript_44225/g.140887 Transcript_44225/m.140887 type:complete len:205 (-) Transcript_44225:228-842(-)